MKISFITTIFNEENTIEKFLDSLLAQTMLPDEIIITDGGSKDKTIDRIKNYELQIKKKKIAFKLLIKKGNRSIGRNEAITHASGDIIVCSDAGNVLDKAWIKNIMKPFENKNVDVVAGYYKGLAKNIFQKCLIPYAFVMPDKVNPETFLPATRSIAFRKNVWEKVGGFDDKLSHNEDYVFSRKLRKLGVKIIFAKNAIAYWIPRNTFREAFIMFFRFAYGDAEAGIFRPKVSFLFVRYFIVAVLYILFVITKNNKLFLTFCVLFFLYIFWAIRKNYRYVKDWRAFYLLPLLQFTADFSVITGTVAGLSKRL